MTRIKQALLHARNNVEDATNLLTVDTTIIDHAIKTQQETYYTEKLSRKAGSDPHQNVRDLMSQDEVVKLCDHMYEKVGESPSLLCTFHYGRNSGLRGASSRGLELCDLRTSTGYGPERNGPNNRTLLIVLRKGPRNKERFTDNNCVGAQRHRDWRQCSIFATALRVIQLLTETPDISFKKPHKNKDADWWGLPLIDFDTLSDQSNLMQDVYKKTGVESCKVTHHRTQCVQFAGTEGLRPDQINTLTKHILQKFFKAYQSQCDKETLKVMSGFLKEQVRFIARELLKLDVMYYVRLLLPRYDEWVRQSKSKGGDKSRCCKNFLHTTLPWLVEVLVVDGIYLIQKFPKYFMSKYLLVSDKCRIPFFCVPPSLVFSRLLGTVNLPFSSFNAGQDSWLPTVG